MASAPNAPSEQPENEDHIIDGARRLEDLRHGRPGSPRASRRLSRRHPGRIPLHHGTVRLRKDDAIQYGRGPGPTHKGHGRGQRDRDGKPSASRQIAYLRCHNIGYIFQSFNLIPVMDRAGKCRAAHGFFGNEEIGIRGEGRLTSCHWWVWGSAFATTRTNSREASSSAWPSPGPLPTTPTWFSRTTPTGNLDLKTGTGDHRAAAETPVGERRHHRHEHARPQDAGRVRPGSWTFVTGRWELVRRRDEIDIQEGRIEGLDIEELSN